jgi:hypothetical protein
MKFRSIMVLVFAAATLVMLAACGSSSDSEAGALAKITPSETIYALDDLVTVGFKKGKTFDVEGLTGATDAYWGFRGIDPYDR